MSYNRVEINLLPPELRPGPAVRFALLINFALVAGLVAFIILDSVMSFARITMLRKDIQDLQAQIDQRQQVVQDYESLTMVRDQITRYGQIIGMAAARYVDLPVVLDRLARILPDGVYVQAVVNQRATQGQTATSCKFTLKTTKPDPELMQRTLEAFKQDKILKQCFLSRADYGEQGLDEYLKQINVTWNAAGTDFESTLSADEYEFDIEAVIEQPMTISGLPLMFDVSRFFSVFAVTPPAGAEASAAGGNVTAGAKAIKEGTTASQGMATVEADEGGK